VSGGLIHHWIGAVFVPNVKLDDVLAVTRDYDHYREFFRPFVSESKAIARTSSNDRFSMVLVNWPPARSMFRHSTARRWLQRCVRTRRGTARSLSFWRHPGAPDAPLDGLLTAHGCLGQGGRTGKLGLSE
jgi:hypothetical protein